MSVNRHIKYYEGDKAWLPNMQQREDVKQSLLDLQPSARNAWLNR